jgi:hypothetical protein
VAKAASAALATTVSDIFMTSGPTRTRRAFGNDARLAGRAGAGWLCLAATPTFAVMALLTALTGGESDPLCTAMQHLSPLRGMLPMYLPMSAFHSAPWLKLIGHIVRLQVRAT